MNFSVDLRRLQNTNLTSAHIDFNTFLNYTFFTPMDGFTQHVNQFLLA